MCLTLCANSIPCNMIWAWCIQTPNIYSVILTAMHASLTAAAWGVEAVKSYSPTRVLVAHAQ